MNWASPSRHRRAPSRPPGRVPGGSRHRTQHRHRRTRRIVAAAATPIAVLVAAALVWHSSWAAFSGSTRNSGNQWSTGSVAVTDDDNGTARFQASGMVPGDTETRCIKVTVNASAPGKVHGYATNPVNANLALAERLIFDVVPGDGGSFATCTGFVADPAATPVLDISLQDFSAIGSWAAADAAMPGWSIGAGTHTRTYRITWTFDTDGLTQQQVDAFQGQSVGVDMQWEFHTDD